MEEGELDRTGFSHEAVFKHLSAQVVFELTGVALLWAAEVPFDLCVVVGSLDPVAAVFHQAVGSELVSDSSEHCLAKSSWILSGFYCSSTTAHYVSSSSRARAIAAVAVAPLAQDLKQLVGVGEESARLLDWLSSHGATARFGAELALITAC